MNFPAPCQCGQLCCPASYVVHDAGGKFSLRCACCCLLEVSPVSLVVLAIRLALFFHCDRERERERERERKREKEREKERERESARGFWGDRFSRSLFDVAGLPPKRSLCNYDVACEPALQTRTQQETPVRAESPWDGGCKLCAIGFLNRWRNGACLYNYLQASRQHAQRKVRLWVCRHVELAEMQNVIRAFKVHHHGAARLSTSLTNSTCPTSARLGWESTVSRKLIHTVWLMHFQTTLVPFSESLVTLTIWFS